MDMMALDSMLSTHIQPPVVVLNGKGGILGGVHAHVVYLKLTYGVCESLEPRKNRHDSGEQGACDRSGAGDVGAEEEVTCMQKIECLSL